MKVLENRIYRHFKGNLYKVLCVAMHTETQERMVVYQALYGDYKYFVRPYEMFVSKVDHDKYPDVKQEYRFELIEEQAQVYSLFLTVRFVNVYKLGVCYNKLY